MSKIDYNLRPAKHIERRMLAEALRRVSWFGTVDSYRYIGFGAVYFRDFLLFHRDLGISTMISIEHDTSEQRPRYNFNRPFQCIEVCFGSSGYILPQLPWDLRTILWLDYEDKLSTTHLSDVRTFCTRANSGSVLIVTVNVQADDTANGTRIQQLEARVGRDSIPVGTTEKDLNGWGAATVTREILVAMIEETLTLRNGTRPENARYEFQQLFNFRYADEAKMATFGGILYERGQRHLVDAGAYGELPFVRKSDDHYLIEVPRLTFREMRHLDAQLPLTAGRNLAGKGIPPSELARYEKVYRYFPSFVAADL
jgi:hypothetical protein